MWRKCSMWALFAVLSLGLLLGALGHATTAAQQQTVTLRMILISPAERYTDPEAGLLALSEQIFEAENPDIDIEIEANIQPFSERLTALRAAASAGTPVDIISLDQPEVGDFAAAGFAADLTEVINRDLDGLSDWFATNREPTRINGRFRAIWAWTDQRVLLYWKDLVEEAGVDPAEDMVTWDGYIRSCQKLNDTLNARGIEGCLQIGQPWIADWTFPYVWMQGGGLGEFVNSAQAEKAGVDTPWFPTLNSAAWVSALQFTRDQIEAGIEPFTEHAFGPAFRDRRFATWLGGTWNVGAILRGATEAEAANLGLIGTFPVPTRGMTTATMAGGWTLAIPTTSENATFDGDVVTGGVAWEFLKVMLRRETLGEMLVAVEGALPTRKSFAEEIDFAGRLWNKGGVDRWSEVQELAQNAFGRPSFPEWPQIASAITEMVQSVQFEDADPFQAAKRAQRQALEVLGWPVGWDEVIKHDDVEGACPHPDEDRAKAVLTVGDKIEDSNQNGQICTHVVAFMDP